MVTNNLLLILDRQVIMPNIMEPPIRQYNYWKGRNSGVVV